MGSICISVKNQAEVETLPEQVAGPEPAAPESAQPAESAPSRQRGAIKRAPLTQDEEPEPVRYIEFLLEHGKLIPFERGESQADELEPGQNAEILRLS